MPEPNVSDAELISKLLEATKLGRIQWEKTALPDQFASTYAGKWTLLVDKSERQTGPDLYWLTLSNSQGEEILKLYDAFFPDIGTLFEAARRHALKVNEAVADLLKELDEDIPF